MGFKPEVGDTVWHGRSLVIVLAELKAGPYTQYSVRHVGSSMEMILDWQARLEPHYAQEVF